MLSIPDERIADDELGAVRMAAAVGHADELLHFLKRRVGCPQDAADLRQETLLRLSRAGAAPIGNVRSYLFQVARHLIADRAREQRRDAGSTASAADENIACEQPGPARIAESASEIEALKRVLATLPERQRLALLWTRLDGLTLCEVGKRLGVSESMASRYVMRAIARCQDALEC